MRASASRTALLLKCAYSFRDDVVIPYEKPSAAATKGKLVHKLIEDYVNSGQDPDIDIDDWAYRRANKAIEIMKAQASYKPQAEISYAMGLDGETLCIGVAERVDYPKDKFCGTADIITHIDDNVVGIRDWKTGQPSDSEEWQLRALAAMVSETGKVVADAKAIYLTDGAPRFGNNALAGTDPKEDAATIRKHLRMVPESKPTPGYWCRAFWCQLRKTCPEAMG